ncbi:MAG TPA: tRNA (N6-threonylcarbamoyladenosine(37)-N6)-methyltransferase TrmO [Gammaproteobacteria bacterium]|nr:tRNA (N6-threonylcarbamoyladenosine(37)-N6)-methyltransferase TrmO [Gammaproteobacteria bacterium]
MNKTPITLNPIGIVHSPFHEKFGIPRQPGLVPEIKGSIELLPPYNRADSVRGLESFSHIWVLFLFHKTASAGWKPTVRPPRLGGKTRVGVFASRSNFRPNPIGQSVVALEHIDLSDNSVVLRIAGHDLLDQTPVIDIKPYLAYSDAIATSRDGYAQSAPSTLQISFSPEAAGQCEALSLSEYGNPMALIKALLEQDPRPAFHKRKEKDRRYGMRLHDFDILFKVSGSTLCVTDIRTTKNGDKR